MARASLPAAWQNSGSPATRQSQVDSFPVAFRYFLIQSVCSLAGSVEWASPEPHRRVEF